MQQNFPVNTVKTVKCGHWYSTIFYSIEKNQRLYNDARRECCRRFVFTCKTENLPHGNVLSFRMKKKIAELSTMCRSHLISYFGKEKYRFQFRARDAIVKFIIFCRVTARTEKTERLVQSSGHGSLI